MKTSTKIIAGVVAALTFISALGCTIDPDLDPFDDLFQPDACAGTTPDLNGIWEISGSGKRFDCREDFLNTDKFLIESLEIPLVYDAETGELTLGDASYSDTFEVKSAVVDRACIEFTTVEQVGDQSIEYRWTANARTNTFFEGEFTGTGPSACESKGNFSMSR